MWKVRSHVCMSAKYYTIYVVGFYVVGLSESIYVVGFYVVGLSESADFCVVYE